MNSFNFKSPGPAKGLGAKTSILGGISLSGARGITTPAPMTRVALPAQETTKSFLAKAIAKPGQVPTKKVSASLISGVFTALSESFSFKGYSTVMSQYMGKFSFFVPETMEAKVGERMDVGCGCGGKKKAVFEVI